MAELVVTTTRDGATEYRHPHLKCLHREDGPAKTWNTNGVECEAWYYNGRIHRDGGPALTWFTGMEWFCRGKSHRTDGPSVVNVDGTVQWWVNGIRYHNNHDYQKAAKLTITQMATVILQHGAVS